MQGEGPAMMGGGADDVVANSHSLCTWGGALTTSLPGAFKLSRIQRHTREADFRAVKKDAEMLRYSKVIKHKSRVTIVIK